MTPEVEKYLDELEAREDSRAAARQAEREHALNVFLVCCTVPFILMFTLKLLGVLLLSWWWVCAPLYPLLLLMAITGLAILLFPNPHR